MGLIFKSIRWMKWARKLGARRLMHVVLRLPSYIRLYSRLFIDPRVPIFGKLLLVGAVAYVVSPLDLLPDFLPIVGELDDLTLLMLAGNRFLAMCPASVRHEHELACGLFHAVPATPV